MRKVTCFCKKLPICPITAALVLAFLLRPSSTRAESPDSQMHFPSKNLTHAANQFETKPSFVADGESILCLVLDGQRLSPRPWDYRLLRCNREGKDRTYLTANGVLEYNFHPNGKAVLVLQIRPTGSGDELPGGWSEEKLKWEVRYIDIQAGQNTLVKASGAEPLSAGYQMLGLEGETPHPSEEVIRWSPKQTSRLLIKTVRENKVITFYSIGSDQERTQVFETGIWNTYSHHAWLPDLIWRNETSFFTMYFEADPNCGQLDQTGRFSIMEVDLATGSRKVIFTDPFLKPFPKLQYDPVRGDVFFQKFGPNEVTELWRINLISRLTEKLYEVNGDLGRAILAPDSSSLLVTQFQDNDFDIIRVDLNQGLVQQMAGK